MILSFQDIRNYGQRIDGNVSAELVNASIQDAELFYLQPMLGDEVFQKLVDLVESGEKNVLIDGGKFVDAETGKSTYIAGAKCAIANIAYAFLIHNKMNATAFGATIKDSDESHTEDPTKYAKFAISAGKCHIQKLADVLGVKLGKPTFQYWEVH